jgi:hypothetical protein
MKIIPPYIRQRNTVSSAEVKIFELAKKTTVSSDWIMLHSLNVSKHQHKKWSELDFVLVSSLGILVFEVKGGRVTCNDGIWIFTDRYGISKRKSEGPFVQAKTGMEALKEMLAEEFGDPSIKKLLMGWGVIFPDISFKIKSPEAPLDVVCDQSRVSGKSEFLKYISDLYKYWDSQNKHRKQGISKVYVDKIVNYLRPNFDLVPSLEVTVGGIVKRMVQLTEEQYKYLDSIETNNRIVCSGGAGTGKTFVAIECARRENKEKKVAFISLNRNFIHFVRLNLDDVDVFAFSELPKTEKYDMLIVDEGQDLLSFSILDELDGILNSGLKQGKWRWFMDFNNQSGVYGDYENEANEASMAKDYLLSIANVEQQLKRNCRNTEEIVTQVEISTGADIGETIIKGQGPKVIYKNARSDEDAAKKLSNILGQWTGENIQLDEIAILSPKKYKDSICSFLPLDWRDRVFSIASEKSIPHGKITYSTIADFKGLEKPFVAIVDLDMEYEKSHLIPLLYISMTRAHAGLCIIANQDLVEFIQRQWKINLVKKKKVKV